MNLQVGNRVWIVAIVCALGGNAIAQEQGEPAQEAGLDARVDAIEERLAQLDGGQGAAEDPWGWQLQLRGGLFHLAHNHRDTILGADKNEDGWHVGVGLKAPLWHKLGPIDLDGQLTISYRQVTGGKFRSALTGATGTWNYLNIAVAPTIAFPVGDTFRPFVMLGFDIQVASPPQDAVTYLDLSFMLGLGFELRLHERLSLGVDYRYSFFGVADQEEEDYGTVSAFLGFNI